MNEDPTATLVSLYESTFRSHGPIPRGVGWGQNHQNIHLRYNNFVSLTAKWAAPLSVFSLVDLGAGYGHFYDYIASSPCSDIIDLYVAVEPADSLYSELTKKLSRSSRHRHISSHSCISQYFRYYSDKSSRTRTFGDRKICLIANGVFTQRAHVGVPEFDQFLLASLLDISDFMQPGDCLLLNTMLSQPDFRLDNLYYPSEAFMSYLVEMTRLRNLVLTITHDNTLCEQYLQFSMP